MHPCIGVSCNPHLSDEENRWEYRHYLQAVEFAGGVPLLISSAEAFTELRSRLDGILLPGGCDIHPSHYGEEVHPKFEKCNPALDELEFLLIRWALSEDMPVLGICRGMQLINIVRGGTLYQDLTAQYPESRDHRIRNEPRCHCVFVQSGSRMEQLLGTQEFWVNSRHHQAVREPGEGVYVSGFAEDGVAELFEVTGYRLIIGAQCHPEEIYSLVPACARLFSALVEESARTRRTVATETMTSTFS
jgi:putative glutamine amidotransferase